MSEHDEMTKRHLAYLAELADMGLDIARIAARQAVQFPERTVELTRVVEMLTRGVLKTTALQRSLAADLVQQPTAAVAPEDYVAPPTSRSVH